MARSRTKHAVRESSPLYAERVFVDTSAWYALASVDDRYHELATEFLDTQTSGLLYVTSLSVVSEFLSLLRARKGAEISAGIQADLFNNPSRLIEMHREEDLAQASVLFAKSPRHVSFVDCLSAVTAQRLKINDVFTFDPWFKDQGLRIVPD